MGANYFMRLSHVFFTLSPLLLHAFHAFFSGTRSLPPWLCRIQRLQGRPCCKPAPQSPFALVLIATKPVKPCDRGVFCLRLKGPNNPMAPEQIFAGELRALAPIWRRPGACRSLFESKFKAPKNAPVARFQGLCCYQTHSEISAPFGARAAAETGFLK